MVSLLFMARIVCVINGQLSPLSEKSNMTNNTKQIILAVAAFTFSLGILGWIAAKIGLLDLILSMAVNFAVIFPIMFVTFGLMNPETFNAWAGEITELKNLVVDRVKNRKNPVEDDVTKC